MKQQELPRLTFKLARLIAKKYFGTAAGLHPDEDTTDAPQHYQRYKMEIGQLQISIGYLPDSNDYSRLPRNCIQLRTYLSCGGVSTFGDNIEQYINPATLEEDHKAELDEASYLIASYDAELEQQFCSHCVTGEL